MGIERTAKRLGHQTYHTNRHNITLYSVVEISISNQTDKSP